MAVSFGVSEENLSAVLNEHKKVNFNRYLNELRIGYIMDKIASDPKYQKYSSTALARECGINTRQSFSIVFSSVAGINFSEFLRNCENEQKK
ncbi:AraC family transcriptional regulator [Chryseobacterium sp. WLY505]|uniref:helix-turn-helix domain-containing protein n=1 Tax=Chryseobacterium sp. WLY505 TaxID=3068892 RepID=UPI002796C141|nr:helix-turn-helix domain-containing protein [Chryseobacterium sp. WLY505]MDQ1857765.1 helix-turn-helix domain-containing protein [Chryseobacterium sp. WLY505]